MMYWQVLLCDGQHTVFSIASGVQQLYFDGLGALCLRVDDVAESASIRICLNSSGLWLYLDHTKPRVHVNGRPIQRLAFLRSGDVVHVEQAAFLIQAQPAFMPPAHPLAVEHECMVLRGLSAALIGRCVRLDAPCCVGRSAHAQLQINDPAIAPIHARLTCESQGLRLVMTAPRQTCVINGHRVRAAWLRSGDQIVFADIYRFLVEGPIQTVAQEPSLPVSAQLPVTANTTPDQWPWLVIAAIGLALLLSGVLWFGAF